MNGAARLDLLAAQRELCIGVVQITQQLQPGGAQVLPGGGGGQRIGRIAWAAGLGAGARPGIAGVAVLVITAFVMLVVAAGAVGVAGLALHRAVPLGQAAGPVAFFILRAAVVGVTGVAGSGFALHLAAGQIALGQATDGFALGQAAGEHLLAGPAARVVGVAALFTGGQGAEGHHAAQQHKSREAGQQAADRGAVDPCFPVRHCKTLAF